VDNVIRSCGGVNVGGSFAQSCVKDNFAFRASAGLSFGWKSPFGPLQIDIGVPFVKAKYDRPQLLHFSAGTGF
jgi:outer membrane protein insertion porin family